MRSIGVVTVARSDYGLYLPIMKRIQEDPDLQLRLIVGGMHLSPEFGSTVNDIERDGFSIDERVELLLSSDSPQGIAKAMALGTLGFAQAFGRLAPDILLLLGDRFEMHSAAVAAVPQLLPIAHMGGGAVTLGAIDDVFRHSMTKMSHLHFAETENDAQRIVQMGEEPWRVSVTGASSLDNLRELPLLNRQELENGFELDLSGPPLLVTYHPVTLEYEQTECQVVELLASLDESNLNVVFTYPNADTRGRKIIEMIDGFVSQRPRAWAVANMGVKAYFSLMSYASAMVGNSSSGIVEAASFKLPVVNIGSRQLGRAQPENVINVGYNRNEISAGIAEATSPRFRAGLEDLVNPYGDGNAAERIVDTLKNATLGDSLLKKGFYDPRTGVTVPECRAAR